MKEERYHVALDDYEHGIIIRSLNDTKTELKKQRQDHRRSGRPHHQVRLCPKEKVQGG